MTTVVPGIEGNIDFIGLVDSVDCVLVVPETEIVSKVSARNYQGDLLFNGDVVAYPAKFSLETDSGVVVRAGGGGVEWGPTLWVGVMVVILLG
jgi:hypothetical protein